jgi:hypothetical protein
MAPKKTTTTEKEKEMAKKLLETMGVGCHPMHCDDLQPCAILCKGLKCPDFSDDMAAKTEVKQFAWPCPTQVICDSFNCTKVNCSKLKTK